MNILFLCTSNLHRSRTAEFYFQKYWPSHNVRSAGLSQSECNRHQSRLCTEELVVWADNIFVMELAHLERIEQNLGKSHSSKITVLGIEDIYQFQQKELVETLISKVDVSSVAIPTPEQDHNWNSWFDGEGVSDDFLLDRGQQKPSK